MSTVVVNGSDPLVYLTNGTRQVLGLTGESSRPQSIVQAAQEAYFAATGQWPYVQGMPNAQPEPKEPVKKSKSPSVSGTAKVGESLTTTDGTFTGGEGAITVLTVWQVSNTGSSGWNWLAKGDSPLVLAAAQAGKYIRSSSTGTDTIDQSANANSTSVGPVEVEALSVADPTVTVSN
jgi:hypothetical protein